MDISQIDHAHATFKASRAIDIHMQSRFRRDDINELSSDVDPVTIIVMAPVLDDALFDRLRDRAISIGKQYPECANAINTGVDINTRPDCTIITAHYIPTAPVYDPRQNSFDSLVDMYLRRWDFGLIVTFRQRTMAHGSNSIVQACHRVVATSERFDSDLFDQLRLLVNNVQAGFTEKLILTEMDVSYNGRSYRVEAVYHEPNVGVNDGL